MSSPPLVPCSVNHRVGIVLVLALLGSLLGGCREDAFLVSVDIKTSYFIHSERARMVFFPRTEDFGALEVRSRFTTDNFKDALFDTGYQDICELYFGFSYQDWPEGIVNIGVGTFADVEGLGPNRLLSFGFLPNASLDKSHTVQLDAQDDFTAVQNEPTPGIVTAKDLCDP